jgi:hypothetical protein
MNNLNHKKMKLVIMTLVILSFLYGCKDINTGMILHQPNSITFDTTLPYFRFVRQYINQINKNEGNINQFILAFYYHENDEELRIKVTGVSNFESFNKRLPNYYFNFKHNIIYVFTGIDMVGKMDSIYIKTIKSQFKNDRTSTFDLKCWEIIYSKDTCYYFIAKYPLIPVSKMFKIFNKKLKSDSLN